MEINMTKETLKVKKVICEKKEMISIQGDMIVPDSKPDILSTVNTSGTICIYKKEMMDGKIRIDGNVLTYIMYLADTSSRENMNDNIKLEVAIEIMASKIASMAKKGYDNNSKEMKKLLQEKKEMYNCNMEVIDKIITIYGEELRK